MRTLIDRFWKYVDKHGEDECWPWIGATILSKYGILSNGSKHVYAHRLSWEIAYGEIPEGLNVCHELRCKDPLCVNPLHLTVCDDRDKTYLMIRRGNYKGGRRYKLSEQKVSNLKYDAQKPHLSVKMLAAIYGVDPDTIRSTAKREGFEISGSNYNKLTLDNADEIKLRHKEGVSQKDLAEIYNVSASMICLIVNGKRKK
jgi:hypothetical protein